MLSKKLAIEVLNTALSTGGDFAEIYFEETTSTGVSLENSKVDSAATVYRSGIGLRILQKNRSVYGHTSDLSRKSLIALAHTLAASFNDKQTVFVERLVTKHVKNINNIEIPFATVKKEEIISYLKKASDVMSETSNEIVKTQAGLSSSSTKIVIYNSNGKVLIDDRSLGRVFLMCVASFEGKIEYNFVGPGTKAGWEFFKAIDIEELAKKTTNKCILMLHAKEAPSGKMPVVLGNGWGGVLFHESCGHPLEASSVSKGLSCFTADMVGTKIASDVVTAYDDGTLPNEWGSSNMDDEGNPTHKNLLIKDGVLKGFLIDQFNGRRMNAHENGASRRQNYKFEPTSRMSNTYIANGKSTKEEIIANTKLGLYAVSFNGGSVNPVTGEFNFGCSEAYIIRDGKIAEPVRGATLIGKGNEILKQIDMVANDCSFGQGMCGAASGSIPTNVGQPTLRIKEITVGGRGGELK